MLGRKTIIQRGLAWVQIVTFLAGTMSSIAQPPGFPQIPEPPEQFRRNPSGPRGPEGASTLTPVEDIYEESSIIQNESRQKLISLNFRDAPLDQILNFYGEITGRTMIKSPGINATVTLKGQTRLTEQEALEAIESVLAMNNVVMVPMGDKFFKVVQPATARQSGMPIDMEVPEDGFADTDKLMSQVIPLKYVEIADVQPVIQGLLHAYGKIQAFERTNSMLVTDTSSNLKVIMEILELIDQPIETRVETRIYEIKYAKASEIAGRLNELISSSQQEKSAPKTAIASPTAATPPGVIRARRPSVASSVAAFEEAMAERGIVQGEVKIIADERTNILIVISRPANFSFFDRIVAVLDREIDAETIVRVVALEYATAEDVAGILNEFIGAAKAESESAARGSTEDQAGGSQGLQEFVRQRAAATDRTRAVTGEEASQIGRLSPNTRILADKRTNALLLMGTRGDIAALEEIIDKLDIMLAQVLIEAVVLEIGLGNNLSHGVEWLQRSYSVYDDAKTVGGVTTRNPLYSFAGGQKFGENNSYQDASQLTGRDIPITSALTYYTTFFDLNLDVVIKLAADSSDVSVLSTPVILTTDNTEASINISEQRPVVTSTSTTDGGSQRSSYEYRDIGIQLTVTPHINPQRFVVMEINQSADEVGEEIMIDDNEVPVILKREMDAQIAVKSRQTVALGGLVRKDRSHSRSKVPILGDIPLIGTLFRSESRSKVRRELLVLITPYVLTTPEEVQTETERLHSASGATKAGWIKGWSDSEFAEISKKQKKVQKKKDKEKRKEPISINLSEYEQWKETTGEVMADEMVELDEQDVPTGEVDGDPDLYAPVPME